MKTTIDCKPKYMYEQPMFMVTVSTVVIDENGVLLVPDESFTQEIKYKFPGGQVKAGQESIQFAALRYVKEQLDIIIKKDSLIPVDFRSDPERSETGNIVDIGFVSILEKGSEHNKGKWVEVDFENKKAQLDNISSFSMDNEVLLKRALEIILMMRT